MAEKKSKFQLILTIVFIIFAVVAVLIFSGALKLGGSTASAPSGQVAIWGTVPKANLTDVVEFFNNTKGQTIKLTYEYKSPETFDMEVVEAIASGRGPDVILLPNDLIIRYADKITALPEAAYPSKLFLESFIGESVLYLGSQGISGLPVSVDPIVMYYNQSILDAAGIALPPATWDDVVAMVPLLAEVDPNFNISKAAISLGTYDNIKNSKDILALLMMQFGSPIVERQGSSLYAVLSSPIDGTNFYPAVEATEFYTQFSNPASDSMYSWNNTLPNSQDMFISGKLAFYLGYASELFYIQAKNPNLDFNVTVVPQVKNSSTKLTFGRMNALAVIKGTKNSAAAFSVLGQLTGPEYAMDMAIALSLPPVRRDLLSVPQSSPYISTFYRSALIARGWHNPSESVSGNLFRELLRDVQSGKESPDGAISKINKELNLILSKVQI